MYRICFICHFSNASIRNSLTLKNWKLRNWICKTIKHQLFSYSDFAIWVTDYIEEFKRFRGDLEFHIISPHIGMKKNLEEFELDGIYYHFFRSDSNLLNDYINAKFCLNEKRDYKNSRNVIMKYVDVINPELVVICGAENPIYSSVALDIENRPVYLLLQTVLNNPKMAQFTQSIGYRVETEKRIFSKVKYFGTGVKEYFDLFRTINSKAFCLPVIWPTHQPEIIQNSQKCYDYVFFGRFTRNKGVEDVVTAFSIVIKKYPKAKLCLIGYADTDYGRLVYQKAIENGCVDNIVFKPAFSDINDVYKEVQKSRFVVVPGITAFNSTAREAMLMGLPVVVYDMPIVEEINSESNCLLAAKMEDTQDLAEKMMFAYEHTKEIAEIAANGKQYADQYYSNKKSGDLIIKNMKAIISHFYNKTPLEAVSL